MKRFVIKLVLLLTVGSVVFFGYKHNSNQSFSDSVTQAQAEDIVRQLPEVKQRMDADGNWIVVAEDRNSGYWHVQVAEVVDEHTATFNWYKLDKQGEIVCSMFTYQGGELQDIPANSCD